MKTLSYLNKYFVKYKWRFLLGIVFTVASNYFGTKMPVIVKEAVHDLLNPNGASLSGSIFWIALKVGGLYMLFSIGKGFFLFLMRQTIIIMSRLIEYDLKNEIFLQYQRLDFSFYKRNNTGDLMNRISEDVSQVRMYLGPGVMYTVNLIVLFIMAITQMILIDPWLTLFVLMPLPLMSLIIYRVSSKINSLSGEVQKEQSRMSTLAQETFSGIRIVKAYGREHEIHQTFNRSADAFKEKNMRLVLVNAFFMPTIFFLIGLSTLLSIYLGGILFYSKTIAAEDITAFILFVNMLT
ncbi:MAG: ABC transporter transmembrane domain-containing protein, partial [Bacteroidota bacterium]